MKAVPSLNRFCLLTPILLFGGCGTSCPRDPVVSTPEPAAKGCFDGERALFHVARVVEFGPRPAGTEALEHTRGYIESSLRSLGLVPRRHPFVAHTPHPDLRQVDMANLTVDIPGSGPGKVLVGGHFDGKILEGIHFVGANDGGSSTGLLLELARCLAEKPPPCGVTLAFFDGEEALVEWSDRDSLYGSKNLVLEMKSAGILSDLRAVVVVDMIGDADLHLFRETLSTPWVQEALMEGSRAAGHPRLWDGPRVGVEDDHLPFLQAGVPSALVIDLNFGPRGSGNEYWHTAQDTMDKLSPSSLQAVGETVLKALPRLCLGQGG
jgi:hypothetical protein